MDLQTDLIGIEESRVVAPLRAGGKYTVFPGLTPTVTFEAKIWVVRVPEFSAVACATLRARVGFLNEHRDALKRALDILIDGV